MNRINTTTSKNQHNDPIITYGDAETTTYTQAPLKIRPSRVDIQQQLKLCESGKRVPVTRLQRRLTVALNTTGSQLQSSQPLLQSQTTFVTTRPTRTEDEIQHKQNETTSQLPSFEREISSTTSIQSEDETQETNESISIQNKEDDKSDEIISAQDKEKTQQPEKTIALQSEDETQETDESISVQSEEDNKSDEVTSKNPIAETQNPQDVQEHGKLYTAACNMVNFVKEHPIAVVAGACTLAAGIYFGTAGIQQLEAGLQQIGAFASSQWQNLLAMISTITLE